MRVFAPLLLVLTLVGLTPALLQADFAVAAESASGTPARIGRAELERATLTIRVPYQGAAPQATLYKLSDTHFYYEIQPARLLTPGVQHQVVGGPLTRFTMAERPGPHTVRLSFQLTKPGRPSLSVDAASHTLVVRPLGQVPVQPWLVPMLPQRLPLPARPQPVASATRAPAKPGVAAIPLGLPTDLQQPFMSHNPRRVVVPYRGAAPRFTARTYGRNPRWLVVDFPAADAGRDTSRYGVLQDSFFEAWMISRRPEPHHTRIYLRMRNPGKVQVHLNAATRELWLLPPGASIGDRPPAPRPTATPRPRPVPSPISTYAPTPMPTRLPSPVPSARPVTPPSLVPLPVIPGLPRPEPTGMPRPLPVIAPSPLPAFSPLPLPSPVALPTASPAPTAPPSIGPLLPGQPMRLPRPDSVN